MRGGPISRGLGLGLAGLALLAGLPGAARGEAAASSDRFDVVVLDPGHGGSNTGARAPSGLLEKDLVLQVALELAARLRADGLRVVMTRDDDTFVPLEQRAWVASDARADLFVSIHANWARDREARGSEIFFLAERASDEHAREVARRENAEFETGEPLAALDDPLLAVLGGLHRDADLRESHDFARRAHGALAVVDPNARRVKQARFVVLHAVQMPSALVELGFLSNAEDERWLGSASGRSSLVQALARAVRDFGADYDARRGLPPAAPERGGE